MDEKSAVNMNNFMSVEQSHSTSEAENIADFQIKDGVLVAYLGSEENVIIPDSVTEIGMGVFSEKKIKTVTIPDSVTIIGKMAFYCCENLLEVIGGRHIEVIDDSAFCDCESMEHFSFSKTLKLIGSNAFAYNELHEINLPDALLKIQSEAFRWSKKLVELSLTGKKLKSLGNGAFSSCPSLQKVYISSDIKEVKGQTFMNCLQLKKVQITGDVAVIGNAVFLGCANLSDIELPDSVEQIESNAFGICVRLEQIKIPSKVLEITDDMFHSCRKLHTVVLPDALKKIGDGAFGECSSMKEIELPSNLQEIDSMAFFRSGLEHITIPESVRKIGDLAFYSDESNSLRNVTINSNNIEVGKVAFVNSMCVDIIVDMLDHGFNYSQIYRKLRSERILVINHSDSQLMANVTFALAYNTEQKNIDQENEEKKVQEDKNNSNHETDGLDTEQSKSEKTSREKRNKDKSYYFQVQNGVLVAYYGYDEDVVIPSSVIEIGIGVFSEKEIKTVKIPDSVVAIGKMAFYHCDHLEKVTGGNGVEIIDDMAFYDCEGLEDFTFSGKLKEIGAGAFAYNVLREIHFPDSLLKIGDDAFRGSKYLRDIDIVGLNSLIFGKRAFSSCKELIKLSVSRIREIDDYCFENCDSLTEVTFARSLNRIGEGVFSKCISLKKVKLPLSTRWIGAKAFDSCEQLTEIILPSSLECLNADIFRNCRSLQIVEFPYKLKKIYSGAFKGCALLKEVHFPNKLEVIESFAFENCSLQNIRIPSSVRKIEWTAFSNITVNDFMPSIRIDSDRIIIEPWAFNYGRVRSKASALMKNGKSISQIMKELNVIIEVPSRNYKMIEAILLGKEYSTEWKVRNQEIKMFGLLLSISGQKENIKVEQLVEKALSNPVWNSCRDMKDEFRKSKIFEAKSV